jgi:hypothetical protein
MAHKTSRRLFTVAIGCAALAGAREVDTCDVCGETLPGRYWTYEDFVCCSQQCVDELRPHCATCNKPIRGKYLEADGLVYCSDTCFNKSLPKCEICEKPIDSGFSIGDHEYCDECGESSPTCFSCGLPAAHPTELTDGRKVCNNCMRWAVRSQEQAQEHYERAARQLEAWTRTKITTLPKLELVSRTEIKDHSSDLRKTDTHVSIRGLYSRQTYMSKKGIFGQWKNDPEKTQETIYIVDHLHDDVFRVACVHELMHDVIYEHFPRLTDAPLWVHEGICQLAAAEYCRLRNYKDILAGIELCTDPDYGDGYRYMDDLTGYNGWHDLKKWMDTVDVESLPKAAPKSEPRIPH